MWLFCVKFLDERFVIKVVLQRWICQKFHWKNKNKINLSLSLSVSLSLSIYIYIYSIQIEILTILKDKANIYLSLSLLGPKTMQTKSFITSIYKERIMNINKLLGLGILKDKAKIYISHSSLGPKAMQSKSFIPPFIRRE